MVKYLQRRVRSLQLIQKHLQRIVRSSNAIVKHLHSYVYNSNMLWQLIKFYSLYFVLMSHQLISQYYTKVDKLIQFSGSRNEETIKSEFANLLNHYAEKKNLLLVREVFVRGTKGKDVRPDGAKKKVLDCTHARLVARQLRLHLKQYLDQTTT